MTARLRRSVIVIRISRGREILTLRFAQGSLRLSAPLTRLSGISYLADFNIVGKAPEALGSNLLEQLHYLVSRAARASQAQAILLSCPTESALLRVDNKILPNAL